MRYPLTAKVADAFNSVISGFSDTELRRALAECDRMTTTNCSWIVYGLRGVIREEIENQMLTRKHMADKIRPGGPR